MTIPEDAIKNLWRQGPLVCLLLIGILTIVITGARGDWVFGKIYENERTERQTTQRERNEYKAAFEKLTDRIDQRSRWIGIQRSREERETAAKEDQQVAAELREQVKKVEKP